MIPDSMSPGWVIFRFVVMIIFVIGLRQTGRIIGEWSYRLYHRLTRERRFARALKGRKHTV